ncbi:hypothetical protein Y032_0267g756 [Ancylostoma ceylanicum]|uniref:GIY-YIG domain-containing protein n=1 Tax=Ancylostoma ceylanicum TaxID=53326 RepID=A0A016S9U2_9BILA|nr:hypothetical protein Y032_0267g756 [Ancylostoma ceylanicum]
MKTLRINVHKNKILEVVLKPWGAAHFGNGQWWLRKGSEPANKAKVVEIPLHNLKRTPIRNRPYDRLCMVPDCVICPEGKQKDCMCAGVVYLITCKECEDEYIGETARPLCTRVEEHLQAKAKFCPSNALGSHRLNYHEGVDFEMKVMILAYESQISARETLEALWINIKTPKMNRKEECSSITRELAPYLQILF